MRFGARAIAGHGTLRSVLGRALRVDPAWLKSVASWLSDRDPWRSFFVEQRCQLRELPLLESRLSHIRARTTVVAGDRDPVVPLHSARSLARQIPTSELIVIPGGGHMLAAQHPNRLAEITRRAASAPPVRAAQRTLGENVSSASSRNACAAGG
jgi:pimeloyl-ACP methyl ester carboxylesterase